MYCDVQTEECMDSFDFEMASLFCRRALDVEPTNLQVLDMLGHVSSELGDTQKAKEISFLAACVHNFVISLHCCDNFILL